MPDITEYGEIVFDTLDEWGRIRIDGLLEDGTIIVIVTIPPTEPPTEKPTGGGGRSLRLEYYPRLIKKRHIPKRKRSLAATKFIIELKEKIMETGVVKNTHKPYNPRTNRRFKVSERQAARIAYSIAKSKGMRVGKFRGPNR